MFAQGLPAPANRAAADAMEGALRRHGAVPAVTAVVRGVPTLGLDAADRERFLGRDGILKLSARDLPWAVATGADGATTVAAALALSVLGGLAVLATGGIGGVHRDARADESADLLELARSPVVVVCAGAKAVLDLPATVERLESLGVGVLGYRTDEFPGFFTARTGLRVGAVAEAPREVADAFRALRALRRPGALLVVQPPPAPAALEPDEVEAAVARALEEARGAGVTGGALTPFLLSAVDRATDGRSLAANLALLEANATLAAEIAGALRA